METQAAINKIYADFKAHWGEDNYPNLFRAFERMRKEEPDEYPHKLGHYAIFYTPVFYPPACDPPKYMLIGNNPSWFRSNAKTSPTAARAAEEEVSKLKIEPPAENLYLTGKFDFGGQMEDVFYRYPHVLKTIVGLNRFWIQTGGDYGKFRENVSDNNALNEFKKIEQKCEGLTRAIVSTLKPKTVFLFGVPAQKTFPKDLQRRYRKSLISCDLISQDHKVFVDVRHPARGGVSEATQTINEYFKNHPPSPQTP